MCIRVHKVLQKLNFRTITTESQKKERKEKMTQTPEVCFFIIEKYHVI